MRAGNGYSSHITSTTPRVLVPMISFVPYRWRHAAHWIVTPVLLLEGVELNTQMLLERDAVEPDKLVVFANFRVRRSIAPSGFV